jgi:dimethylargininase
MLKKQKVLFSLTTYYAKIIFLKNGFSKMFQNAIVRTPAPSLVFGLTTASELGKPDYELALIQHQIYIEALSQCGLEITNLPAIEAYPDSCFVEDVALLTEHCAILTRPGAESRQGEVAHIDQTVRLFYKDKITKINTPGTLEAGDILRIENHFFIGLSARTNKEGAQQIIQTLTSYGYTASTIELKEFLHLKTGVSYLDKGYLLVNGELINHPALSHFNQIIVDDNEAYAANCIMVNGTVLLPQGYPKTKNAINKHGFPIIELNVSEFRKVDGGLSCLSLRF